MIFIHTLEQLLALKLTKLGQNCGHIHLRLLQTNINTCFYTDRVYLLTLFDDIMVLAELILKAISPSLCQSVVIIIFYS